MPGAIGDDFPLVIIPALDAQLPQQIYAQNRIVLASLAQGW